MPFEGARRSYLHAMRNRRHTRREPLSPTVRWDGSIGPAGRSSAGGVHGRLDNHGMSEERVTTLSPNAIASAPRTGMRPGASRVPRVGGLGRRGWLVATLPHGGMLMRR
jgi:hypothetical protein